MTIEYWNDLFATYGYVIIFVSLFFGIVGIPAPEESLLVIIGMAAASHELSVGTSSFVAVFGSVVGMIVAYFLGRWIGLPVIQRFGHFVGFSEEKFHKVRTKYERRSRLTLTFGYYLPGVRQISPYVAGVSQLHFISFVLYATLGAILWTLPYLFFGYFIASRMEIPPIYITSVGFILFGAFIIFTLIRFIFKKEPQQS